MNIFAFTLGGHAQRHQHRAENSQQLRGRNSTAKLEEGSRFVLEAALTRHFLVGDPRTFADFK